MRPLLNTIAIYLLVGPIIGLATLLLSMQLRSGFSISFSKSDVYLIPLSYVFGVLPALGAGLATYLLRKHASGVGLAAVSGIVGAILSSVIWITQPDALVTALQLGAIPGFFAGVGAALLARNSLRWPSENPFKPSPLPGSA